MQTSEDKIKVINRKIKNAVGDYKRALYDHNYEYAANLKKYIAALREEKKALEDS